LLHIYREITPEWLQAYRETTPEWLHIYRETTPEWLQAYREENTLLITKHLFVVLHSIGVRKMVKVK